MFNLVDRGLLKNLINAVDGCYKLKPGDPQVIFEL